MFGNKIATSNMQAIIKECLDFLCKDVMGLPNFFTQVEKNTEKHQKKIGENGKKTVKFSGWPEKVCLGYISATIQCRKLKLS